MISCDRWNWGSWDRACALKSFISISSYLKLSFTKSSMSPMRSSSNSIGGGACTPCALDLLAFFGSVATVSFSLGRFSTGSLLLFSVLSASRFLDFFSSGTGVSQSSAASSAFHFKYSDHISSSSYPYSYDWSFCSCWWTLSPRPPRPPRPPLRPRPLPRLSFGGFNASCSRREGASPMTCVLGSRARAIELSWEIYIRPYFDEVTGWTYCKKIFWPPTCVVKGLFRWTCNWTVIWATQ